ncbi:PAS domain S-box protein [Bacillus sp. B190/17]|uniref:histidine kinase n=1 Tax=Bacillus lumedeiriae TaxID=3058829 RepID=A0ABW8I6M2_9BACI
MNKAGAEQAIENEIATWFVEGAREILLLLDEQGIIKYANAAFNKLMPSYFKVPGNKYLFQLIHEEDREEAARRLLLLEKRSKFNSFSSRYFHEDGGYGHLLWQRAEKTEQGWILVAAESLEGKHPSCQEDGSWLHFIVNHTEEPGEAVDLCGRVFVINEMFEQVYGWTEKEIVGKTFPTIPEQYQHEWRRMIDKMCQTKKPVTFQTMRMKKDGKTFLAAVTLSPIYERSGRVFLCFTTTKDLTEDFKTKRLIEQQNQIIAEREKLICNITRNITEMVTLFDLKQNKFLYISPSYGELFDTDIDHLYENPHIMLENCHSEDVQKLIQFFSMSTNTPRELEYRIIRNKESEPRWVCTKITPIADADGRFNRYISITRDITDSKKREMMIRKWDKLNAVGQLAAGIAHEIRNPLTSVKGFMQLLAQETNHKYTNIMLLELERIEFIMNEFLMLAKPHQEMRLELSAIHKVLQEVVEFMEPEALLHNVEVHTSFCERSPLVYCEPKQIKQVIINLIKNAIEAMPGGGSIYITTSVTSNKQISIEVRDEGTGIPKERLERLGEPFYSNKEKGTGLGLMMCYKIMENHQGTIHFVSTEGEGTTAFVLLPLANEH